MAVRGMVDKLIRRYGTSFVLLRSDGNRDIKGIMQITGTASRQNMQTNFAPLGEVPRGRYLLLVPAEPEIEKGDVLIRSEEELYFTVCRVERVWFRDETLYCWCLCEERGASGAWAKQS